MTRGMLAGLKGKWAREIAKKEGASAEEVVSFALPFGGPPSREGAGAGTSEVWQTAGAIARLMDIHNAVA